MRKSLASAEWAWCPRVRAAGGTLWFAIFWGIISGMAVRGGGLPEPDLLLYGTVRNVNGGQNVRLTAGTLSWTFQPAGGGAPVVVSAVLTNINEQFSYVVRVPCETALASFPSASPALRLGGSFDRSQVSVDGRKANFVQANQTTLILATSERGRIERVDLEVSFASSGGLPENWQLQYFGRTGIDPLGDPDGDGVNNQDEYRSGTNPTDANSLFEIKVVENAAGGPRLTWPSAAGVVYLLQRSGSVAGGFQDYGAEVPATPPQNEFRDTIPNGAGPFFYRLRARRVTP